MTKLLKKSVRKPESERTTKEKLLRNAIFLALIAFVLLLTYKLMDAEMSLTEAEMQSIPSNIAPYAVSGEAGFVDQEMPVMSGEMMTTSGNMMAEEETEMLSGEGETELAETMNE